MYDDNDAAQFQHHALGERFRQAVSWSDTIATLIGWFGWRQLVASIALAILGWVWGYIRSEPVATLSMSAVSVFVALAYLLKLPALSKIMAGKPNAKIWRGVDPITLWQAACLLDDISPPNGMGTFFPTKDAEAYYSAMVTGFDELEKVPSPHLPPGTPPTMYDHGIGVATCITRASLVRFADKRGFKARFLR